MHWQTEFPLHQDLIYLNHAAVAPWPARTLAAVNQFAKENVEYGARNYPSWLTTENKLRERLRKFINAPSVDDIALLKNTSEALSVIAYGIDWKPGDNLIISDQEFPSNRIVWESLSRFGVEVKVATLSASDSPEDAIIHLIDNRTRLISISSVQYATGLRMDCAVLGEACQQRDLLFCIDAIQSIGAGPFDVQAYHADFVVADGHKWMLGPEGLALFYTSPKARKLLSIQQFGWHMVKNRGDYDRLSWEPADNAQRFECGSPNMLGAHALNASLSLLEEVGSKEVARRIDEKVDYLINQLQQLPEIHLISDLRPERRSGIVTFKHSSIAAQQLHQQLLAANIVCACRGGGIRFSPHFYTSTDKLSTAIDFIRRICGPIVSS